MLVISPTFDSGRESRLYDTLWITAGRIDNRIEPIPCGERQWEEDDGSAILAEARRDGIRIMISGEE